MAPAMYKRVDPIFPYKQSMSPPRINPRDRRPFEPRGRSHWGGW